MTTPSDAARTEAARTTGGTGLRLRNPVEAIDLLDSAGAPVLKRLGPVVGALVALLAVFLIVKRARS